jgi:iron complex transport system substrate-binding protein
MKRLALGIVVFGLAAGAFYLRFSQLAKPKAPPPPQTVIASPGMPHDYVAQPLVDPSERQTGPQRIVSMAPSITELCAALGLADRVVGRTQFCTYPPSVQQAEIVGGYADPNLEKIVALRPDLILITTSSPRLRDKLAALHLSVKELPDSSFEDVFVAIRLLGQYADRPRTADALVRALQADLDRLHAAPAALPLRVLVVIGPLPTSPAAVYVAGPGSFLDRLVQLAGHYNALAGRVYRPWAEISSETIVAAQPDAILEARGNPAPGIFDTIYQAWSDFASVPAIANRRICSIPDESVLVPGPRVNISLYYVIDALSKAPAFQ